MQISIPVYEERLRGALHWTTLRLGEDTKSFVGYSQASLEQKLVDTLRAVIAKTRPDDMDRFQLVSGMSVTRIRLELDLRGEAGRRKVSGACPLVIEPRWASGSERIHVVYHPARQLEAFWMRPDDDLALRARRHFQAMWAELDDETIASLWRETKPRITVVGFSAEPRSIYEDLPRRRAGGPGDARADAEQKRRAGQRVLAELGDNLTQKVARGTLDTGTPRSPYREQLQLLLASRKKQSTLVVGPSGCGKTTLIHRWIADLLEADGYLTHRNFNRAHVVWQVSGKRVIAGMSHLGEWEKRTSEILDAARGQRVVLVIPDIAHFGRIGRSRESDRALGDMFRGPVARRQITIVGECTPEGLQRLEEEAPGLASLFRVVHVAEASEDETFRLMVRTMRALEQKHGVRVSPLAVRAILEVGGALLSARARPGRAIDLLVELTRAARDAQRGDEREGSEKGKRALETRDVIEALATKTGLPRVLLEADLPLDASALERDLAREVRGQDEAVRVAANLIIRIKAGLGDPRRPQGVLLFTGPTGTGKTELAKCIAEYLYGSTSRLLRFDMSELSGPDAPSRLVGDRYQPEGLLTQRVKEQPFSVVLFDEIEKAHRSVLNLLLQLFDDARLTDASGTAVDFSQTAIIMTSNLGARARSTVGFGEAPDAVMHDVAKAVRSFFPPELFNRIDRIVPFRPLGAEVAAEVAKKELTKLLTRSGLRERNIHVQVNVSVARSVAEAAFRAEDGARSVKRYLEDHIGTMLTEELAGSAPAAMQTIRIYAAKGSHAFGIVREAITECLPAPGSFPLEPLLGLSAARLRERLPVLRAFLAEVEASGALERLAERLREHLDGHRLGEADRATPLFNLEAMRGAFHAYRERVEELTRADDAHERIEMDVFGVLSIPDRHWSVGGRYRLFARTMIPHAAPHPSRWDLLTAIAEGHFLRRVLQLVDDPSGHAVIIELLRTSEPDAAVRFEERSEGLLEALVRRYAGTRGALEAFAVAAGPGRALAGAKAFDATTTLEDAMRAGAAHVVLKIVGLAVFDFFALEHGTHVLHSRDGVEIVRVHVRRAEPVDAPADILLRHATELAQFERTLDAAAGAPHEEAESPARLLPLVRTIRFDASRRKGALAEADVEDYALGYATVLNVRSLEDALAPLTLLAMSRDTTAAEGARS